MIYFEFLKNKKNNEKLIIERKLKWFLAGTVVIICE